MKAKKITQETEEWTEREKGKQYEWARDETLYAGYGSLLLKEAPRKLLAQ